jgi:hypothetical protein
MTDGYAIALALYCLGWFNNVVLCLAFKDTPEGFNVTNGQVAILAFLWPLSVFLGVYLAIEKFFRRAS